MTTFIFKSALHAVRLLPALLLTACASTPPDDGTRISRNPDNGLLTYSKDENGFSIELIQVVPDFIRAVYANHSFPEDVIEDIAAYCVYGSVIKNTSGKPLRYRVADWYYVLDGERHPVKTKTQWLQQWRQRGIVFSWTLLPDAGDFYQGDWQQGFTTVKAPRGSRFDFHYSWTVDGEPRHAVLSDMQCPPEHVKVPS